MTESIEPYLLCIHRSVSSFRASVAAILMSLGAEGMVAGKRSMCRQGEGCGRGNGSTAAGKTFSPDLFGRAAQDVHVTPAKHSTQHTKRLNCLWSLQCLLTAAVGHPLLFNWICVVSICLLVMAVRINVTRQAKL